jgi:hypothetical protein
MGEVFAGFDPRLERPVAIKRLLPAALTHVPHAHDLRSEARHAARLTHPGIVRLYDVLEFEGADYLISELVDGVSLSELVRSRPDQRLPLDRALEIGSEIAAALTYAHERGIVHRDVKAANVLVSKDGEVKLTDFGISARVHGLGPPADVSGIIVRSGTFSAVSPEQTLGDYTDARSDLFSLGTLLYELLSGVAPFADPDPAVTLRLVRTAHPLPLAEISPNVPGPVSKLVERLLQKRREDRPESGREVQTILESAARQGRPSVTHVDQAGHIERQLAVVCVRFETSSSKATASGVYLLDSMRKLRDAINQVGGTVLGTAASGLTFCVGYPVAHENNCEEAIRLLLAFSSSVGAFASCVTAGLDWGTIAIAEGTPILAIGSALEEAASIAEHAEPGSISVSLGAQTLVRRFFRFAPSVRALHGGERNTQLYRIVEAVSHDQGIELVSATPLRSRAEQLQKLHRAFFDACQNAVITRLVIGDAGVGKSRLLHEWRKSVEQAPDAILAAYGTVHEQAVPFAPWVRLWHSWFGLHAASNVDESRKRLRSALAQLGIGAPALLPALEYALQIPEPGNALIEMPRERRRHAIVDAFASLVVALAETRLLVLIVEDVHFVDRSSLEVLQRAIESPSTAKLLILLTARPEVLSTWAFAARIARVEVDRLSPGEALRLMESIAAPRALTPDTARRLLELGDGVPLVLEELTRAVLSGAVNDDPGEPQLLNCPTTLTDSVSMRLAEVGPAKELIRAAAALGRESPLDVVRSVVQTGTEEFRSRLHRLVAARLIHLRQAEGTEWCVFSHALVQEAVNKTVSNAESRELHARIAGVLDQRFSDRVAKQPGRFAHIYEKAEALQRALELREDAAVRAFESSSYHEASAHLQAALSLLQGREQRDHQRERRLRQRLGPCLGAIDGWSSKAVEQNVQRTYALGAGSAELREILALWAHALVTHDSEKVRTALAAVTQLPKSLEQEFVAYTLRGVTAFYRGDFAVARQALELAVAMLPDFEMSSGAEQNFVLVHAREWGCEFAVAASLHLCWLEAFSGGRDRVSALLEQAERLLTELSIDAENRELRHGLYMRVHLGLTFADYELFGHSGLVNGEGPLHRLFELAGTGLQYYRCVAQIGDARARVAKRGPNALDELAHAYDRMRSLSRRVTGHVFLSTVVAEGCLEAGEATLAARFIGDALEIAGSEFARFFASEAYRVAALQRLAVDDTTGAREALRKARSACTRLQGGDVLAPRLFEERIAQAELAVNERALRRTPSPLS